MHDHKDTIIEGHINGHLNRNYMIIYWPEGSQFSSINSICGKYHQHQTAVVAPNDSLNHLFYKWQTQT